MTVFEGLGEVKETSGYYIGVDTHLKHVSNCQSSFIFVGCHSEEVVSSEKMLYGGLCISGHCYSYCHTSHPHTHPYPYPIMITVVLCIHP